jgi:hypothetical protein
MADLFNFVLTTSPSGLRLIPLKSMLASIG